MGYSPAPLLFGAWGFFFNLHDERLNCTKQCFWKWILPQRMGRLGLHIKTTGRAKTAYPSPWVFVCCSTLSNAFPIAYTTIVWKTGGMKGRRKELTREALHQQLGRDFVSRPFKWIRYDWTTFTSLLQRRRTVCPPHGWGHSHDISDPLAHTKTMEKPAD